MTGHQEASKGAHQETYLMTEDHQGATMFEDHLEAMIGVHQEIGMMTEAHQGAMMIEDHLEDMREHLPEIDMMIGAHQETDMMIGALHETDMMIEVIILIVGIESLVGCSCFNFYNVYNIFQGKVCLKQIQSKFMHKLNMDNIMVQFQN